jgi:glycosyltransferase involved in cell wall biosynthesis
VVVGRSGRQTPELKKILRQLSKPGKIVLLDGVNTAELVKLFRSSLALVSASTMEGFDYPLLEAKAEGLPTIISDIPVHHEIHENTSLYFNPEQGSDELIEAIVGLAYDQTLWDHLSVSGRNLIAKFTITEQQSRIRKLLS